MDNLLRQVKNQLESWEEWHKVKTIVLAISGGVDSMVLMQLMLELMSLQEYQDRQLVVAHFNHQLRDPEVHLREQALVVQSAIDRDLIYFVSKWENPVRSNTEALARQARYQFLADVVHATQADCLLTAHHQDDAVETLLMRLIRGSSLKTMTGMSPYYRRVMQSTNGQAQLTWMFRPLINVRKKEIYDYAHSHQIDYYEDTSNSSDLYLRNRLRNQILPLLEEENPQLYSNWMKMQEYLVASYQLHFQSYLDLEASLVARLHPGHWVLDVKNWRELSQEARKIYLTVFFEERLQDRFGQYDKEAIPKLNLQITQIENPNSQFDIAPGWMSWRSYDKIHIQEKSSMDHEWTPVQTMIEILHFNKWYALGNGGWIGIFEKSFASNQMKQAVDYYLPLDLHQMDRIPRFYLRHRLDGDTLTLKMNEQIYHKKVSRILIDDKVPMQERDRVWLVVDDLGQIVWLVGHRASSVYQVNNQEVPSHYIFMQNMS